MDAKPSLLRPVKYADGIGNFNIALSPKPLSVKTLKGVDIFLHETDKNVEKLADKINTINNANPLSLQMITNRGTKVWPNGFPETFCTDHWRCRFKNPGFDVAYSDILHLMQELNNAGMDIIKTENLYYFNNEPGFTAAQGQ